MTLHYRDYLDQIENWIENHKQEYLSELDRLVRIRSVAEKTDGKYPFGEGAAKALDYALNIAETYGFETENDDYYTGSAVWHGTNRNHGAAFVCHLDVVPDGTGWNYPPYEPTVVGHQMVGRGASDNKGSALAALFALRCLKELGISLNYTYRVLWGCQEEAGMNDMPYFLKMHKNNLPDLFLVCDSLFPLHHGEKGIMTADLVTKLPGDHVIGFQGGLVSNSVPDKASAVLKNICAKELQKCITDKLISIEEMGETILVTASGISGHAAFPENTDNAIGRLARALAGSGLVKGREQEVFDFLGNAVSAYDGQALGVASSDDISGKTTAIGGVVSLKDGILRQNLNIRYVIKADQEKLINGLLQAAKVHGFEVENLNNDPPVYLPLDYMNSLPSKLTALAEDLINIPHLDPVVLAGATHMRKLPNALGFGPNVKQSGYADPPKIGVAHGPDEAVDLNVMWRAIKIYASSMIMLDEILSKELED